VFTGVMQQTVGRVGDVQGAGPGGVKGLGR